MGNDATSIELFSRGTELLAEANTIQKAKDLKNLALTAADWAKRKDMGNEAIQLCRGYALEAERKMGEMLAETERAKPPGHNQHKKEDRLPVVTEAPTLKELGVSKRQSVAVQSLAALPAAEFEQVKAGKKTCSAATHKPSPPKKPKPDAPVVSCFDDDDDTKPKKSDPKPAAKDQVGQAITDPAIAEIFGRRQELQDLMTMVTKIKSAVMQAKDKKDLLFHHVNASRFAIDCDNIRTAIKFCIPYAVCSVCGGDGGLNKTCGACKKSGWLNQAEYELVPKGM